MIFNPHWSTVSQLIPHANIRDNRFTAHKAECIFACLHVTVTFGVVYESTLIMNLLIHKQDLTVVSTKARSIHYIHSS